MLPPRAAESDGQIALALANVMRNEIGKKAFDPAQEFTRLRKRTNVLADLRVRAIALTQSRNEMRVGKKAHVKDEVRIRRNAIAIAETDHRHEQRACFGILETSGNEVPKLVHVELCGIDNHVGKLADGLHQRAFVA